MKINNTSIVRVFNHEEFSENKANLFIFPEGNNSVYKDKTLREKFQLEVTKIIKKVFEKKQEKASKRFDRLENMKRKYDEKPYEHKMSTGKMVCKEVISDYNYSKDNNMKLSLRK